MQHANCLPSLAGGMKSLPSGASGLSDTQALWRFLNNPRGGPADLSQPLLEITRKGIEESCDTYALAIHDWSRLNYRSHESKLDRIRMTHENDVGYELQSTVLVSDRDGSPLSSPVQNLRTAAGLLSSRANEVQRVDPHLDELSGRMAWLEQQELGRPLVPIVDREADSVGHLRQWHAQGCLWLIRVKAGGRVRWGDKTLKLSDIACAQVKQKLQQLR